MGWSILREVHGMTRWPPVPIPKPLRGAESGTFAHRTVVSRLPSILSRTLEETAFPQDVQSRLRALAREIPHASIRPLQDPGAPDAPDWARYIAPYLDMDWLEVPWFFAEMYFYRRILEATGYFCTGNPLDPFAAEKRVALVNAVDDLKAVQRWLDGRADVSGWGSPAFSGLVRFTLWGNQADLSLWSARRREQPRVEAGVEARSHIIVDDTEAMVARMAKRRRATQVDVLVDNAGLELAGDLLLADLMLRRGMASTVRFHLKPHPTFVSDATAQDLDWTLDFLGRVEDGGLRALAERARASLHVGRLRATTDLYWTSPLAGWEMPERVRRDLAKADLVISKGDANYRRLLGDCHWPFTLPFGDAVGYFPAPLVALRTLKSEVIVGLQAGQSEGMAAQDPDWLVDGQWGVVQFRPGVQRS